MKHKMEKFLLLFCKSGDGGGYTSESCLVEEEKTPHQKKNERLCGSIWCDKKIILRPCLVLRVTVCVLCNKIEK